MMIRTNAKNIFHHIRTMMITSQGLYMVCFSIELSKIQRKFYSTKLALIVISRFYPCTNFCISDKSITLHEGASNEFLTSGHVYFDFTISVKFIKRTFTYGSADAITHKPSSLLSHT